MEKTEKLPFQFQPALKILFFSPEKLDGKANVEELAKTLRKINPKLMLTLEYVRISDPKTRKYGITEAPAMVVESPNGTISKHVGEEGIHDFLFNIFQLTELQPIILPDYDKSPKIASYFAAMNRNLLSGMENPHSPLFVRQFLSQNLPEKTTRSKG